MPQNYSNVATQTALTNATTAGATTIQVGATTGFPAVTFTLVIDPGTASEELVLVTNVAGTTLTVTRGHDGTSGASHSVGAVVQHVHSAKDFADSRAHEAATTGVHGVSGAVVGTTSTQTLTNKTLTSPAATGDLSAFGPTWTSYTPAWTGSTTDPVLGNGTITGRYQQVGKSVDFYIRLVIGSTTTMGSGSWRFSLPATSAFSTNDPLGMLGVIDVSPVARYQQVAYQVSSSLVGGYTPGGSQLLTPTTPITFATGDIVAISGRYLTT